jgi:hypothetical protein
MSNRRFRMSAPKGENGFVGGTLVSSAGQDETIAGKLSVISVE